jgi:L-fuconolactonase
VRLDAHQHFWRISRGDYGWLTPALAAIHRDFGPEDLQPSLRLHAIDGTILVQAASTVAETRWLLEVAENARFVRGVVGWCDFEQVSAAAAIDELAATMSLVGLRPMVQDIADDDWLLRPAIARALSALEAHRLVFDALVLPRHLSRLRVVVDRHPDLSFVIDHGAKPPIADGWASASLDAWRAGIAELAARANTLCKLSGLVTEAGDGWTVRQLQPVVDHLLQCFGSDRLLWGSDWPVVNLAGSYDSWTDASERLLHALSADERAAVFGGNAARTYLTHRGRRRVSSLTTPPSAPESGAGQNRA